MAQSLHHEHIVRINDPANITGAWLTREQLWAGLHHTVLAPELLDKSIDSYSNSLGFAIQPVHSPAAR